MMIEFISSTFQQSSSKSMLYCPSSAFLCDKNAFVVNSVISISIRFCPELSFPIEGPMTHQNIQGGICGQDGLDLSRVKFKPQSSPHPNSYPPPPNVILRGGPIENLVHRAQNS